MLLVFRKQRRGVGEEMLEDTVSQLKMFRFAEGFKYTNSRNSRTPAR